MLAPREFPEWLPAAVRDEAQRILGSEGADEALVLRLATDERMEAVWRELEKHKTDKPCQLSDRWATLMRDRVDVPPPDSSDPLVLFFWYAYTIAWLGPITGNTSEWDNPIAQYRAEAALLRYSAARLCELNAQYGSLTSMRDESGNVQDRFTKEYASQIEDAAKFADASNIAFRFISCAPALITVFTPC